MILFSYSIFILGIHQRAVGNAFIGGDFTLVDHDGKVVTNSTFGGMYRLVYFGKLLISVEFSS